MLENTFSIGTNSALVVGPVGRNAELGADITFKGGIFTYSRSKGLFAGIGLKGIAITPNRTANHSYYQGVYTAREILSGTAVEPSRNGKKLIDAIAIYSK